MTKTIEERLRHDNPQARISVAEAGDTGPYKIYDVVIRKRVIAHNPNYPDDNRCMCGHVYYRHFDPYENWNAVGCKYCGCAHFVHELSGERLSPFARMKRFGQWSVAIDDYILQWDMFGYTQYPTLSDYLGCTLREWLTLTEPPYKEAPYIAGIENDEEFVEAV